MGGRAWRQIEPSGPHQIHNSLREARAKVLFQERYRQGCIWPFTLFPIPCLGLMPFVVYCLSDSSGRWKVPENNQDHHRPREPASVEAYRLSLSHSSIAYSAGYFRRKRGRMGTTHLLVPSPVWLWTALIHLSCRTCQEFLRSRVPNRGHCTQQ
jgi:hypothetical protein